MKKKIFSPFCPSFYSSPLFKDPALSFFSNKHNFFKYISSTKQHNHILHLEKVFPLLYIGWKKIFLFANESCKSIIGYVEKTYHQRCYLCFFSFLLDLLNVSLFCFKRFDSDKHIIKLNEVFSFFF